MRNFVVISVFLSVIRDYFSSHFFMDSPAVMRGSFFVSLECVKLVILRYLFFDSGRVRPRFGAWTKTGGA